MQAQAITNTATTHTIQVNHNLNVAAGTFLVQNTNIQTIRVLNNLIVDGTFTVLEHCSSHQPHPGIVRRPFRLRYF